MNLMMSFGWGKWDNHLFALIQQKNIDQHKF